MVYAVVRFKTWYLTERLRSCTVGGRVFVEEIC